MNKQIFDRFVANNCNAYRQFDKKNSTKLVKIRQD